MSRQKITVKVLELNPGKQYVIKNTPGLDDNLFSQIAEGFRNFQKDNSAKIVLINGVDLDFEVVNDEQA